MFELVIQYPVLNLKTISQRSSFDKGNKTLIWVVFATELTGCLHSSLFSTVTVPPSTGRASDHGAANHLRCAFRTGDPVTRREYVHVASTKTSLFSTVTVPPVPGIWAYFCGHIGSFKQVSSHRIAPIPPRCRRKPLAQITWLRHGCRSSDSRIRDERLKW